VLKSRIYGCLLLFLCTASPAFAQDFDPGAILVERRLADLEAESMRVKGLLKALFGNDDIIVVLDGQRDELVRLKNEIGRLSNELAALRAEVRLRDTKPGETPTLTLRAPFAVIGSNGRELLRVSDENARLAAPFRVTASDRPILEMVDTGMTMRGSFKVNNAAGTPVAFLEPTADGSTVFTVGTGLTKGAATLGALAGKDGFLHVSTRSGTDGVRVGTPAERPMGVYVFGASDTEVQASIGLDEGKKGIVRIGAPSAAHGTLGHTKSGGVSFALYDGPGPDFRIGLLAAPDMSYVRLNKAKNAIHLNVDGNSGGAVHLFNSSGNAAASLQSTPSGYGRFSLGNVSGDTMVEAGVTTDNLGIVRAGPRIGGPATNNLTGLPFAIVGKKPSAGGGQD
jgi:hypothetical protein